VRLGSWECLRNRLPAAYRADRSQLAKTRPVL